MLLLPVAAISRLARLTAPPMSIFATSIVMALRSKQSGESSYSISRSREENSHSMTVPLGFIHRLSKKRHMQLHPMEASKSVYHLIVRKLHGGSQQMFFGGRHLCNVGDLGYFWVPSRQSNVEGLNNGFDMKSDTIEKEASQFRRSIIARRTDETNLY